MAPDCHRARHFGEQKFSLLAQNWLISPLLYLNVAAPINIALSNVRPRAEAGEYKRPPFIQDLSLIFLLLAYNHNRKAFMTAHENENRDLLTTDQRSELDPPNRRHLDWEGGALSMDTLLQFHPPSPPYSERTRIEHGLLFSNHAKCIYIYFLDHFYWPEKERGTNKTLSWKTNISCPLNQANLPGTYVLQIG